MQAFLHNPTVKAAEENREMIIEGMLKSLKTLSLLADGDDDSLCLGDEVGWTQPGEVVTSFSNFEVRGQWWEDQDIRGCVTQQPVAA